MLRTKRSFSKKRKRYIQGGFLLA